MDLSSIDTDTKLSEAEVDTFVANNGYLTSETDDQALSLSGTTLTLEDGGTAINLDTTFATDQEVTNAINNADYGDFFADGSVSMTGDLDMGGNNITNVHCLFLTDPSTGDQIKLEFVGGELIAGGTPVVMATAKMQQTTALAFANLDVSMDGSVDITTLVSGGDGTGAFEYSVISNAVLTGTTLSWLTADAPFAIQSRRIGDDDYYTSPWYQQVYALLDWSTPQSITRYEPETSYNNDRYGIYLAVDGDTFVTSSSGGGVVTSDPAVAHVFVRDGSGWVEQALINPFTLPGETHIVDLDAIALSGDTLVLGYADQISRNGSVFIYTRDAGGSWTFQQKIQGGTDDEAGDMVAIEGNTLVIAENNDGSGSNGNVLVYKYDGSSWVLDQTINNEGNVDFGAGLALSGDTLVVGDRLATHVYVTDGTSYSLQQTIADGETSGSYGNFALALEDDTLVVSEEVTSGTLYEVSVYTRSGTVWTEQHTFTGTATENFELGEGAVDLAGDTLVVSGTGYFNLYTREGSTWTLEYTDDYTSHAGAHNTGFGQRSVAISDTSVWVSDIYYTNPDTGDRTGAFWIYDY